MSVGIIICSRVKSNRLYQKVLQRIGNKTAIEILLDHVINDKYPVVLAIPENEDDDILQQIAIDKGVEVFRGHDDSPLHRTVSCAEQFGFDTVVRITHDDILIDKLLLFAQINFHLKGEHDYTFMRRCPEGVAGEVIELSALKKVMNKIGKKPVEFISYYVKTNEFKVKEYYPISYDYQFTYRLTMDYPEDLMLLRILFSSLHDGFGTLDFLNFLHNHKYLLQINKLPSVTIYTCNYNTGKFIIDNLNSIFNQDYDDYELILIDDNSNDDSMNIISEYYTKLPVNKQAKFKIYRNEKNIGLPACCNKILDLARGKYIIRVDSDDTIAPNCISKMVNEITEKNVQGVFSAYNETKSRLTMTAMILDNMWHPACCLLSKWAVNEIKYKTDLKFEEGKDFFDKFKRDYKTSFISDVLWNYRQHEAQKTKHPEHPKNKIEVK